MERVSPVLRDDFDLRANISAILRRVTAGYDFDLPDRFLARGYDSRTTQPKAVHAYAIDLVIVAGDPLSIGANLWLILSLENAIVRGAAQCLGPGYEGSSVACPLPRIVSDNSR